MNYNDVNTLLNELNRHKTHYMAAPLYQREQRFRALQCMDSDELKAIYHLTDSHVPSLRMKTLMRYEHLLEKSPENSALTLSKNNISLKCPAEGHIKEILDILKELPEEWTIVQLTPQYNPLEDMNLDNNKFYTNSIHVSVFNCGKVQSTPVLVTVDAPKDRVNGSPVELVAEMNAIIVENKAALSSSKHQTHFKTQAEKKNYVSRRQCVEDRLKLMVKDIQEMWLGEWRCLFIGNYVNKKLDAQIKSGIKDFFDIHSYLQYLTPKIEVLLYYITKGCDYLKLIQLKKALQYCFPDNKDKTFVKSLAAYIKSLNTKLELSTARKHPVILVVDETLDCFPFELLDVLEDQPVSRVPSLHFVYSLFKEHEHEIEEGHKIVTRYGQGSYIINPDMDLKNMETRMMNFFNYWAPEWTGVCGYQPSPNEFYELLTSSEVFSYNGHGSGGHLLSSERVQRSHVKAVVLLFGCGSVKVNRLDPQVEMYGLYHTYLIARCPCVVGMLWEVTDLDTDTLTTDFISNWIPSKAATHWKYIDKAKWKHGQEIELQASTRPSAGKNLHEPELLRALCKSKKSLNYYTTKAACVARGLPVKIKII